MSEDRGNRTERGQPPAPYGTEDTVAAPPTPAPPHTAMPTESSPALPAIDPQRYRVVGEVGRGGLGRVSEARDVYLDRKVAVKELLDKDEPAQRRFVREALITARLQHPAIVPIYDAGQNAELGSFYAMKLVAGTSLAEKIAQAKTLDQRLALLPSVIAVCDAMAYAHKERIIHRDLKPQNVLVGDFGETVLIDWGLAKDLTAKDALSIGPYREASESTQTMDGAVMGTPSFMAPEQAAVAERVDERADVYALGAMLYYLGAGVPPHAGKTVDEILVKAIAGDVMPLHEREPRIPADLAAIVAKAMRHDPAQRYPTARELSEDLHKFQTGKLVGAKQYTRTERLKRWVVRNRRVVAVVGIALAILAGYGGWSVSQIYAERRRAEDQATRAVAAAADAAKQRDNAIAQAMLVRARQYAATGHAAEELAVLRVLASGGEASASSRLAIEEGGLVWKAHQRLAMAVGRDVGLAVRSADGTRFIATEPGAIAVWDVATGREQARMRLDTATAAAARFGKLVAISPTLRYALVAECAKPGETCGIAILGDYAVQLRADTKLELRELATGKSHATWNGGESMRRNSLAFAIDDSAIAIRRGDRVQLVGMSREVDAAGCDGALAVGPAAAHVAIACKDHVRLVGHDGAAKRILEDKAPWQVHIVAADRLLAVGSERVKLWDLARGELRGEGDLPEAPDSGSVRDEGDDIEWTYLRPQPLDRGKPKVVAVPQIRIGSATSIVPRTSLLGPPPRLVAGGALVTLEGPDWQALALDRDQLRYAMIDHLVPSEPPERCLPRIGGERHAAVALDGGARMLVDEQELPAGLAVAPPEGYRHTTTDELPVRQLRPLVAAELDACLVWGSAVGARSTDGGEVTPDARAIAIGDDVLVLDHRASRITPRGERSVIATPGATVTDPPQASPRGTHLASLDLDRGTLAIVELAKGTVVRTFAAPGATRFAWIAPDVVEVVAGAATHLVAIDPAIATRAREADLVTDPSSRFGVRRIGPELVVLAIADGKEVARYVEPGDARPLPDDTARILVDNAGTRSVLAPAGRITLTPNRHARLGTLEVADYHLVSRTDDSVAVWNLATGAAFALPLGARDVLLRGGELWTVVGGRKPKLLRIRLDGKGTREIRLQTPGLPLQHVRDQLHISRDGKRFIARYAIGEELRARAIWDAERGTLLWVGPPASSIAGEWVLSGGRAYVPVFALDALLRDTGARTNLRVCEDDLRAVPVTPPPPADTFWAPKSACGS